MTKNQETLSHFFSTIYSTMHNIKTRPYIKNLRHAFLSDDSENKY